MTGRSHLLTIDLFEIKILREATRARPENNLEGTISSISQFLTEKGALGLKAFRSERFRRLSKEGIWIVFGQAAAVVGTLVGVRLLTELLSPAAYGELALGMTAATLINQTLFGPLVSGAIRFYASAADQDDISGYLKGVLRLTFGASAIVILVSVISVVVLSIIGRLDLIVIASLASLFAILSGYNSILSGIQNAARQRSIVALHQGMDSWARFLVAAALIAWLGASSSVALVGFSIAISLVLGSQCMFFQKIIPTHRPSVDNERVWREQVYRYSWPMVVTGITSWGLLASQRWALGVFATAADVGHFSAIFQIGVTPFMLAGGILLTLLTPIFYARVGDGLDKQKVNLVAESIIKLCLVSMLVVLVSAVIGLTFHEAIFRLLVGEQYRAYSRYLPFAILAGGILQVSLFLSTIILASGRTRLSIPINTVGNFIIIAINFLATYRFGMEGLFVAMVAGSIIHLSWNSYNAWRVFHNV